jgi:hypothetical protein
VDEIPSQQLRREPMANSPWVKKLLDKNKVITRELILKEETEKPGDALARLDKVAKKEFIPYQGYTQKLWLNQPNYCYVVAIAMDDFEEVFGDDPGQMVSYYTQHSNHPYLDRRSMTIGWVRFTELESGDVWIDEVQTDLTNKKLNLIEEEQIAALGGLNGINQYLAENFLQEIQQRGYGKIYLPSLQVKLDNYSSTPPPPKSVFEDLPRKLRMRPVKIGETGIAFEDQELPDIVAAVHINSSMQQAQVEEVVAVTVDEKNWMMFGRKRQAWEYLGELSDEMFRGIMRQVPNRPMAVEDIPQGAMEAFDDVQVDTDMNPEEKVWVLASVLPPITAEALDVAAEALLAFNR